MRTLLGSMLLLGRGLWRVLPRRGDEPKSVPAWRAPRPADDRSTTMRWVQRVIGAVGVVLLLWGVVVLVTSVSLTVRHYLGLVLWLGGAVVLHDAVLVPAITLLRTGLQRVGGDLPRGGVQLVQAGFVVGAVLTLTTAPEIYAKSLGSNNPTVLPSEYGPRLVATWAVIVLVVVIGNAALLVRDRVRRRTTPAD